MKDWWLVTSIRRRSREQWENQFMEAVTDLRIWVQENGEKAFIGGIVGGMFVILAFKLTMLLLVLGVLVVLGVWFIAEPGAIDGTKSQLGEEKRNE